MQASQEFCQGFRINTDNLKESATRLNKTFYILKRKVMDHLMLRGPSGKISLLVSICRRFYCLDFYIFYIIYRWKYDLKLHLLNIWHWNVFHCNYNHRRCPFCCTAAYREDVVKPKRHSQKIWAGCFLCSYSCKEQNGGSKYRAWNCNPSKPRNRCRNNWPFEVGVRFV